MKAYDLDGSFPNNNVVYRIQNGAFDKFTIGAETGIISVAQGASLDPDLIQPKRMSYSLKILALDSAPGDMQLHAVAIVNITIQDVNNKLPTFIDPEPTKIKENIAVTY